MREDLEICSYGHSSVAFSCNIQCPTCLMRDKMQDKINNLLEELEKIRI